MLWPDFNWTNSTFPDTTETGYAPAWKATPLT